MAKRNKRYSPVLKARVALEALKEQQTLAEISSQFGVHSKQIYNWRNQVKAELPNIFRNGINKELQEKDQLIDRLYRQIGQLTIELDWIKKSLDLTTSEKVELIEPDHPSISLRRQCALLQLNRSTWYFQPYRKPEVSEADRNLMKEIDKDYIKFPYYGSRKIARHLSQELKKRINRKRIQRLMRVMGIEAIYPKPKTSKPAAGHQIYPYLLKGITVNYPNHVWGVDITYIPLKGSFMYLVVVMDWYSRYVLAWELSDRMTVEFCIACLEKAQMTIWMF